MQSTYTPISCSYYDRLEALATTRTRSRIVYTSINEEADTPTEHEVSAIITDLFSKDKAEYMVLDSGETIRLDQIVSINGVALAMAC